ncbi:uncharacterized protein LOC119446040 isoform X7 [Dermacentor silvarum]|uniref:uncharacterized protein LOC119446040 isoform X7 n=1 Tax=Dermacentor silvarum TaxID=543639 RepID=UPI0021010F1C|nr:uncharacterized protein LOC119446040 isoform X7 [Dermacentor silvarum]
MKRTTGALFAFAVAVAAYQDCSKYRITITALDNSTCIPNYYRGKFDGLDLIPIPGQKCTSTVEVMRNCNCENRGLMPAARYCIYNITRTEDDNTASITLGLCAYGKCRVDDFSTNFEVDLRNLQLAHILKEFPRPPCIAVNMSVTPQLTAVAGCEFFCYKRQNKDINDGRPCVFQKTNLLSRDVVGVCNAGACSQVRQVDGCDVIYYPRRRQSPIGVVKQCVCSTRAVTTTLVDGILCAFRRAVSWTGMKLLEVGVCTKGQCVARRKTCFHAFPPDRPVPYQFQKKECKIGNVQVSAELIVGASCTATCRRFETEHRRNGTLCLLQYTREEKLVGPAKKTYTIGECFSGKCLRTKNSWDIKL